VRADLADWDQTEPLVPAAAAALGAPLTALVNCASMFENDEAQSFTRESWAMHMEANLRAPCQLAQALAAQLPEGVDGAIVNITDQRVWKLTPQFFSYTLSKAALATATKTLAQALAPRVRVNAVAPGPTLKNARQSEADFAKQCAATVLERGGLPQDVADAVAYLLSARAVTGQMIAPDGGQHLAWRTPDVDGIVE
jgi:NAD(P)-dependent dehydrogenase (short-subunit alcohol dehydrogenase family)